MALTPPPLNIPSPLDPTNYDSYAFPYMQWLATHGNEMQPYVDRLNTLNSSNSFGNFYSIPLVKGSTWYYPQIVGYGSAGTGSSFNTAQIYYFPLVLPSNMSVINIGSYVTTAGTGTFSFGLYSDLNGKPNTKICQSGSFDTATTGSKTSSFYCSLIAGNIYWVGMLVAGTPTFYLQNISPTGYVRSELGIQSIGGTFYPVPFYQSGIALPTTAIPIVSTGSAYQPPLIYLQGTVS